MACCPTEDKYGYDDSRFEKAVDAHFYCSICYNVLKEPMMCRNNEHIFCRGCITEHLTVNSHTCPECNEDLTVQTLRKARLASSYLSELKIKCNYSDRGCQEYIRLQQLDSHVEKCGFAPVKCSNEECQMVVNKLELIHHESTVCEYRKVKCHNCGKIEQDIEGMNQKIEALIARMEGVEVCGNEVKGLMVQMSEKLHLLENTIQMSSAINYAMNALTEDILVAGGFGKDGHYLQSVERFYWKNKVWEKVLSLEIGRKGATSFVYKNQFFVAGGCNSHLIEVLDLPGLMHRNLSEGKLPYHCGSLQSVIYQGCAVLFCACGKSDYCVKLCLAPPYSCKQLCKIPEPARKNFRVVAFEHKVLIFGGRNVSNDQPLDNVLEFDLVTNTFNDMPPLPRILYSMAVVRWGDQAVLMGGLDSDGPSKKVLMYDSKTGVVTKLPSMLEERDACSAVINSSNIIVVMGGKRKSGRLRSVEAFTLGGYSWRYLPAMNDTRSVLTATVLPTKIFQ